MKKSQYLLSTALLLIMASLPSSVSAFECPAWLSKIFSKDASTKITIKKVYVKNPVPGETYLIDMGDEVEIGLAKYVDTEGNVVSKNHKYPIDASRIMEYRPVNSFKHEDLEIITGEKYLVKDSDGLWSPSKVNAITKEGYVNAGHGAKLLPPKNVKGYTPVDLVSQEGTDFQAGTRALFHVGDGEFIIDEVLVVTKEKFVRRKLQRMDNFIPLSETRAINFVEEFNYKRLKIKPGKEYEIFNNAFWVSRTVEKITEDGLIKFEGREIFYHPSRLR